MVIFGREGFGGRGERWSWGGSDNHPSTFLLFRFLTLLEQVQLAGAGLGGSAESSDGAAGGSGSVEGVSAAQLKSLRDDIVGELKDALAQNAAASTVAGGGGGTNQSWRSIGNRSFAPN